MKIKHLASVMVACLLLSFYSCTKSSSEPDKPPGSGDNGASINITGMSFPATITVRMGTTVKWTNKDAAAHTVTSDDGNTFDSGNMATGAVFSYVANKAGTIDYHCNYHGGMRGTLVVTP